MRPTGGFVVTIALGIGLIYQSSRAPQAGARVQDGFTLPAGFEIERVAGPPLVERPIVADFDEQGRLYVADSSGSSDKVDKQLIDRPHRIVRLEDTDGDGRFDSSVVFAERMMLPEGTLWFDGSLYVAAPPSIWKLTDTDNDGRADRYEEWFQGKTLTGCANDLHGPYLGPDGWIYWTKGAFAEQTYVRAGRAPLVTKAAHIFRRRPGDAAIEPVMTGGMDNPVDVDFTPGGERIFTATFLEHPQLGKRDALVHAVYGGVYGKPHAVIDGHARTGDLMPVLSQLGPAVPVGLTRYAAAVFGNEYRDSFFAAMFNLHKVTRHVLEPKGATFVSHDSDFVVSDNRDFHPTDVIEDADGSLLVVDTGPWYKLCCPTSQLAKPEVRGAIYRVRRSGSPRVADPRGGKLPWDRMRPADVAALLGDARPAVVERALHAIGKAGTAAVPAVRDVLKASGAADARRNAVWALTRIDSADARAAVRTALADGDTTVRQAALHAAGLWRDRDAFPAITGALRSNVPALQRVAAEALGRIGDPRAVPDLIAMAARETDRVLDHSLTYALIEIDNPAATAAGLQAAAPRSRRAALIALDQMESSRLEPDAVLPLLDAPEPLLADTAWWIASHHPDWGDALAPLVRARLRATASTAAQRDDLQQKLAAFGSNPAVQALIADTVLTAPTADARKTALRAMAAAATTSASRVKELPAAWIEPVARALGDADAEVTRLAISVVRAAPASERGATDLRAALLTLAHDEGRSLEQRVDALAAVPGGFPVVDIRVFDLLRHALDPAQPLAVRTGAAATLERARLDREQLLGLAGTLERTGPLELPRLLPAFDSGSDEALGLAMLAALERSKSRGAIRPDVLRPRLVHYPARVQERGEALLTAIHADSGRQAQRLDELLGATRDGDIRRGQLVFNSDKAGCMACHAIGYMGGKVGPDLTRIGQVRSERDLLEAIVFPSASFARSYEPVVVTTRSGAVYRGVVRGDGADELILATGAADDTRIPRTDIADMQPADVSIMPSGYADQLTRQELADLLAFLKATAPRAQQE